MRAEILFRNGIMIDRKEVTLMDNGWVKVGEKNDGDMLYPPWKIEYVEPKSE